MNSHEEDDFIGCPSAEVDDLTRQLREIEAANPMQLRFDESTLPPRDFQIRTNEEAEWAQDAFRILRAHHVKVMRDIDRRQAAMVVAMALKPVIGQA